MSNYSVLLDVLPFHIIMNLTNSIHDTIDMVLNTQIFDGYPFDQIGYLKDQSFDKLFNQIQSITIWQTYIKSQ